MIDFKFNRPFYREKDFLKIISIPRSTFYSWQSEWISKGRDPRLMGKVYIKGSSSVYWNGPKYINWLIENKIETDPKYDYEVEQKNRALVVVNNLEKKKNG